MKSTFVYLVDQKHGGYRVLAVNTNEKRSAEIAGTHTREVRYVIVGAINHNVDETHTPREFCLGL